MTRAPFRSVDELVEALEGLQDQPSDDVVAALPHLLQTAHRLAGPYCEDPELVAAGLVHDLASALELGCADHARVGAALMAPLLGERVGRLVGGHTDAKRYLVAIDPGYDAGLSANSALTLIGQGGPMDRGERSAFERRADLAALVALRRADDAAKVPGRSVAPARSWRPLLERVAAANRERLTAESTAPS